MAVTTNDVNDALGTFRANPKPETAAMFLSKLREAEEIGVVDDDVFHNGLAEIESYLWEGGSVR